MELACRLATHSPQNFKQLLRMLLALGCRPIANGVDRSYQSYRSGSELSELSEWIGVIRVLVFLANGQQLIANSQRLTAIAVRA